MPNNNSANLFALIDDDKAPVKRIPLTASLSRELAAMFATQEQELIADTSPITFIGSYNVDQGEIFKIDDYPLPQHLISALENPLTCNILDLSDGTGKIKALFSGTWQSNEKSVSFQVFDSGKLLKQGITIIGSGDTYRKLEDPGLVLQDKITAQFKDETLYFKSYHNTKRILDLSRYYIEATDSDLDEFADNELFEFESIETFKENADSVIRKKVALLQKNNVLNGLSIQDIQQVASNFNQELPEDHHITVNVNVDGKLVIPEGKRELKELIRFLDEDYVTAPLTKRKCLTNSKQYL